MVFRCPRTGGLVWALVAFLVMVESSRWWLVAAGEDPSHLKTRGSLKGRAGTGTVAGRLPPRKGVTLALDPAHLEWTSASDGQILLQGRPFRIRGISWSGVEIKEGIFQGLNVTSLDTIADFLAAHFNVLRLPFSAQFALSDPYTRHHNSSYVGFGLEGKSTWEVFDAVVDAMANRGVLVMLDLHLLQNSRGFAELWYDDHYTEDDTMKAWHRMMDRYGDRWNVFALDIKNEPHGIASWGNNNLSTDYNRFYERAIDDLSASYPLWKGLYLVEGVQFNQDCDPGMCSKYPEWWGGGFDGAKKVYSPHVYGPSVFAQPYLNDPSFPANLPHVWEEMYGWMIPSLGRGIIIGEWGGSYEGRDRVTLDALANWLKSKCLTNTIWWALNPASGDTGGMLESDWKTVSRPKMGLLQRLQPSYSQLWWEGGQLFFYSGVPSDSRACPHHHHTEE